jgi:hypothetical protein
MKVSPTTLTHHHKRLQPPQTMAPSKRSSRAVAARQSKLSFKSNVSKAAPINSALKKDTTTSQKRAKSPTVQNIDDPSQEVGEEQPRIQQKQLKSTTTKEEEAARKISSLRLKQYYATILNSRLTAPGKQLFRIRRCSSSNSAVQSINTPSPSRKRSCVILTSARSMGLASASLEPTAGNVPIAWVSSRRSKR